MGDLVLVVDQLLPRNLWCLGRIVSVNQNVDGNVRSADVKVSRCKVGNNLRIDKTILSRPISKLILLRPSSDL